MLQSIHFHVPKTILSRKEKVDSTPHRLRTHDPFLHKPTSLYLLSSSSSSSSHLQLSVTQEDGPIELSPDIPSIFATNDDPTPLQIATSVLLTGAITVFLFRSLRRRAKRAKDLRMRSTGATSLKEEALDSLKAMGNFSLESKKTPSPVQALLGGITAGVIALILYKFTTTIEAALNRQPLSDGFSARQITVTIRTIINGLCYLATFIFGFNSIGLFLYAGQIALKSVVEDPTDSDSKTNDKSDAGSRDLPSESQNTNENIDSDSTS